MLHAWTLEYQHMMVDGGYLQRQKAKDQLEKTAGRPRNVWLNKVQEDANSLYCHLRCGDLRSPGVTKRRNGPLELRDDDDEDDEG